MQAARTSGELFSSSLRPFEYHEPHTTAQAVSLLGRYKGKARILAGGTDLIVTMRRGGLAAAAVINIKKIPALFYQPKAERGRILLSPVTTLTEMAESSVLRRKVPVLAAAAAMMASPQVRNRATVGGNLCTGSPSGDMAPPLIALDAKVVVKSKSGQKTLPLEDFFTGPGETILGAAGMLVQIQVPIPGKNDRSAYRKHFVRTNMERPIVSVAVRVRRRGRKIADARIAAGGAGPTPLRLRETERALKGSAGDDDSLLRVAEVARSECAPPDDMQGSGEYKADMVKVFLVRALKEVAQ